MTDILGRLVDLQVQAEKGRSHYYVLAVARAAHDEIASLRTELAAARGDNNRMIAENAALRLSFEKMKAEAARRDQVNAELRSRLAELEKP